MKSSYSKYWKYESRPSNCFKLVTAQETLLYQPKFRMYFLAGYFDRIEKKNKTKSVFFNFQHPTDGFNSVSINSLISTLSNWNLWKILNSLVENTFLVLFSWFYIKIEHSNMKIGNFRAVRFETIRRCRFVFSTLWMGRFYYLNSQSIAMDTIKSF